MTPKQLVAALKTHGSLKAIARNTDTPWRHVQSAYRSAVEAKLLKPLGMGRKTNQAVKLKSRVKALRTKRVVGSRFILTCAQNNTLVHEATWNNLLALAEHYGAKLMVSEFMYYRNAVGQRKNDKAQLTKGQELPPEDIWFDQRILPYVYNERAKIANGLVFCGELNILPTAARPLSGLEVYTGRASMIVPHVKMACQSIATVGGSGTKLNYSTGTVTLRNYIQRKEGFKAEFHHCYGGLLVEIDDEGSWFCRQLNADSDGVIYDLDLKVQNKQVIPCPPQQTYVECISFGDIHVDEIDEAVANETWGEGGMVDQLHPKEQHFNDVLDFSRRGHHMVKDPFKRFKRFVMKKENVRTEVAGVKQFLEWAHRDGCESIVMDSNHDRHLVRWLAEQDGREDPINAEFWFEMNGKAYDYIRKHHKEPLMLQLALDMVGGVPAKLIDANTSHVICRKFAGGIECSQHGDKGANGARGSLPGFAKFGRRTNTGHSHVAGIHDGAWSAGTKSKLQLEYNSGASSWSHTDIITYENGKRTLVTFHDGKWRA